MNAAGQVLLEFILLAVVFLLIVAKISKNIPLTFSSASPSLGGKIEQRLETGSGYFVQGGTWDYPIKPKGGVTQ